MQTLINRPVTIPYGYMVMVMVRVRCSNSVDLPLLASYMPVEKMTQTREGESRPVGLRIIGSCLLIHLFIVFRVTLDDPICHMRQTQRKRLHLHGQPHGCTSDKMVMMQMQVDWYC